MDTLTPAQAQVKEVLGDKFNQFKSLADIYVKGGSDDQAFMISTMLVTGATPDKAEKLLLGIKVYLKHFGS